MSFRLVIRETAERDIAEAAQWYREQSPGLGGQFVLAVDEALQVILERPLTFPEVEQHIRRALLRRFPFGVYFVLSDEAVSVVAVLHGSRNPEYWRRRV